MTNTQRTKAVAAVLAHRHLGDAAAAAGISRSTLERWRREPGFEAELRRESRRHLDGTVARVRATTGAALDVLVGLLGDEAPAIRLRAATALLDVAVRCSVDELDARVAALESGGPARKVEP